MDTDLAGVTVTDAARLTSVTEDLREYAAEQGIADEEALKKGMDEKSKEFVEHGAELDSKIGGVRTSPKDLAMPFPHRCYLIVRETVENSCLVDCPGALVRLHNQLRDCKFDCGRDVTLL